MPLWNTGEPVGTPVRGNGVKVMTAGSTLRNWVRTEDKDNAKYIQLTASYLHKQTLLKNMGVVPLDRSLIVVCIKFGANEVESEVMAGNSYGHTSAVGV